MVDDSEHVIMQYIQYYVGNDNLQSKKGADRGSIETFATFHPISLIRVNPSLFVQVLYQSPPQRNECLQAGTLICFGPSFLLSLPLPCCNTGCVDVRCRECV